LKQEYLDQQNNRKEKTMPPVINKKKATSIGIAKAALK
jgi:hypothetical protein